MTARISDVDLNAFHDAELPEAEAARVAAALEADPALRARLAALAADRRRLAAAAEAGESDPASDALAARLATALEARRRRARARRLSGAALALAAVGAAGWFGHAALFPDAAGGSAGFVADAAGAHAVFAHDPVHPVEYGPEAEAEMRAWFQSHLGEDAPVPRLDELGFALVGGRLLGDAEGPLAQLIYENAARDRVSLIYGRRAASGGEDIKLVKIGKSLAGWWRSGDYAWAVIEDSPGADIGVIATHVARLAEEAAAR